MSLISSRFELESGVQSSILVGFPQVVRVVELDEDDEVRCDPSDDLQKKRRILNERGKIRRNPVFTVYTSV